MNPDIETKTTNEDDTEEDQIQNQHIGSHGR